MKSVVKIGVGCLVLCMIGCGGDGDKDKSESNTDKASSTNSSAETEDNRGEERIDKTESNNDKAKSTNSSANRIPGTWKVELYTYDKEKFEALVANPPADFAEKSAIAFARKARDSETFFEFRENGTIEEWRGIGKANAEGSWKLVEQGEMKLVLEIANKTNSFNVTWIGKDELTLDTETFDTTYLKRWLHCQRKKGVTLSDLTLRTVRRRSEMIQVRGITLLVQLSGLRRANSIRPSSATTKRSGRQVGMIISTSNVPKYGR